MAEPALDSVADLFALDVDFQRRVIRPSGELDLATAGMLLEAARSFGTAASDSAEADDNTRDITIDCTNVSMISSAGLNVLVEISTRQHERRANLLLLNVNSTLKRTLVIGGCAGLL